MKHVKTREELLKLNDEVNVYEKQSILGMWNASKINEFRRLNSIQVQTTISKLTSLFHKYYQVDADGKVKMDKDAEGKPIRVMNEGMTEEKFKEQRQVILNEQVTIDV